MYVHSMSLHVETCNRAPVRATPQLLPMREKYNKIIKKFNVHHVSKPIMVMRCPALQASLDMCVNCKNIIKYKVQS